MTVGLWALVALAGVAPAMFAQALTKSPVRARRSRALDLIAAGALALVAGTTIIASGERVAWICGAVAFAIGLTCGVVMVLRERRRTVREDGARATI